MHTLLLALAVLLASSAHLVHAQNKIKQREMNSDAIVPLRSHSIYAPYVDSNLQNKFWDFGANAIVDTNRHIRLTQDRPSETGFLWSRLPLESESFEITFEFKIDGKSNHLAGDGMAMWLTQERARVGPVFGSINYFTGLGIFFDTYPNARHPYTFPRISVMLGNGVEAYDGGKDGARQELTGCSIDFRRTKVATKAKLTHRPGIFTELLIHHDEWDHWEPCFKVDNITLPSKPYLGFTALTGDVSDAHDIMSVSTNTLLFPKLSHVELVNERLKHFPKTPGSGTHVDMSHTYGIGFFHGLFLFLWIIIKWAAILALVGALVFAGLQYQRRHNVSCVPCPALPYLALRVSLYTF